MSINRVPFCTVPLPYLIDCNCKQFQPNEYHCSRIADYFVLIFMVKGHLNFTENGKSICLQEGEWYIQRKKMQQSADCSSTTAKYYYFHFQAEYALDAYNQIILPIKGTYSMTVLQPFLRKLCMLFHQTPQNPFEVQSEFLMILNMLYDQEKVHTPLTASVMHFLEEHAAEKITARTLEQQFHYSCAYIDRRLKTEIGVTAHVYLMSFRLQKAAHLLTHTESSVHEIAQQCGYSESSLFYKAFVQYHGQSPSSYRKEHRIHA